MLKLLKSLYSFHRLIRLIIAVNCAQMNIYLNERHSIFLNHDQEMSRIFRLRTRKIEIFKYRLSIEVEEIIRAIIDQSN